MSAKKSKNNKKSVGYNKQKQPTLKKRTFFDRIVEPIDSDNFFMRNLWFFAAFLLPAVVMYVLFVKADIEPYGINQILATDSWHQYYPFFADFHRKLQNGDSLLWSWSSGGGVNYLGVISYYLGSPLNLLSIFVPAERLIEFFAVLTCVKVGFASFFFAHFLRIVFKKRDVGVFAFGIMYASCGYIAGYYWNIIWLDTLALFPLVVAGAVCLLKDGKFRLYVISLALAILTNYYIGLFVCVFIVFTSIVYCIVEFTNFRDLVKKFFTMLGYSLLGIAITAMITLPAFFALQTTQSSIEPGTTYSNTPPKGIQIYISSIQEDDGTVYDPKNPDDPQKTDDPSPKAVFRGITDAFGNILPNTINFVDPNVKQGKLPNIYCGIATLVLAVIYFTCNKISGKEKIAAGVLCLIFFLSFIIKWLDFAWHGFHFPNMLPYRYSFLLSFVILTMAYRVLMNLDSIKLVHVLVSSALILGLFGSMLGRFGFDLKNDSSLASEHGQEFVDKITNIAFYAPIAIAIIVILWVLMQSLEVVPKSAVALLVAVVCIVECCCSLYFGVNKIGVTPADSYPLGKDNTLALVDKVNELEKDSKDIVRTEVTKYHTLNDNALIGTNGISMFSSMVNSDVTAYMGSLGLSGYVASSRYTYQETSPVTNMLLSVKYLISPTYNRHTDHVYTSEVYSHNDAKLLKNNYYLPIGFMVKKDTLKYDYELLERDNAYREQYLKENVVNGYVPDPFEKDTDAYHPNPFDAQNRLFTYMTGINRNVYTEIENPEKPDKNSLKFVAPKDGTVLVFFSSKYDSRVSVVTATKNLSNYVKDPYIMNGGQVKAGEVITVSVSSGYMYCADVHCAMLNDDVFLQGYNKLKSGAINITKNEGTVIEGTVKAQEDGLFYTSISYDAGWKAYVDGEEVEITPVSNAQVAFEVPKGDHTITLKYVPKGFVVGVVLSISAVLIFAAVILWTYKKEWLLNLFSKKNEELVRRNNQ